MDGWKQVKRKKLVLEKLSLPPEESRSEDGASGSASAAVSCASSVMGRPSKLDF